MVICLFEVKPPLELLLETHRNLAICHRVEALVYIKVLPVGKSQTKYHIKVHGVFCTYIVHT